MPRGAQAQDSSYVASTPSKQVAISAAAKVAHLDQAQCYQPLTQLQNHKPQRLLFAQRLSTAFKKFVPTLLKLQILNTLRKEEFTSFIQVISLTTRFLRAPPACLTF